MGISKHLTFKRAPCRRLLIEGSAHDNTSMSAVPVLDGLIEPLSRCLDSESSRRVIEFQIDPSIDERMTIMAERANEGLLTPDEHAEYEALINAADFISILKLKARQHLNSSPQ